MFGKKVKPRIVIFIMIILLITLAIFILHNSGKNLFEITQLLTVYVAASFRILPSVNRIISGMQYMKLSYPAMNVLYNELSNFKKEDTSSHKKFSFEKKDFGRYKKI